MNGSKPHGPGNRRTRRRRPLHGAAPCFLSLPHEPDCGRDIALRCPRPRNSGRNRCAAARGADGAARRPYRVQGFKARKFSWDSHPDPLPWGTAVELRVFSGHWKRRRGKLRRSGIFIVNDRPSQEAPAGRHVQFNVAPMELEMFWGSLAIKMSPRWGWENPLMLNSMAVLPWGEGEPFPARSMIRRFAFPLSEACFSFSQRLRGNGVKFLPAYRNNRGTFEFSESSGKAAGFPR